MIFPKPISIRDALASANAKRVLALSPAIGTAEMEQLPAAIRARAFYSARTPYAGYLADSQKLIEQLVQPDAMILPDGSLAAVGPGASVSPARVRTLMRQHLQSLGYQPDPDKRGGLQDLASDERIDLIIDTQTKMARGYGRWKQSQDPTILTAWPADELYRALTRLQERNWQERWNTERRALGDRTSATVASQSNGPFVALKNDPIWAAISRFGNPYPPFDFRSGMRVRDVSRARAESLGVLRPETRNPKPEERPFNNPDDLRRIPDGLPGPLVAALRTVFADVLQGALS